MKILLASTFAARLLFQVNTYVNFADILFSPLLRCRIHTNTFTQKIFQYAVNGKQEGEKGLHCMNSIPVLHSVGNYTKSSLHIRSYRVSQQVLDRKLVFELTSGWLTGQPEPEVTKIKRKFTNSNPQSQVPVHFQVNRNRKWPKSKSQNLTFRANFRFTSGLTGTGSEQKL